MSSRRNIRSDGSAQQTQVTSFHSAKRPVAEETMISCPQVVSTNPEQVLDGSVDS